MSSQLLSTPLRGSLEEYAHIFIFIGVAFGLSLFLLILSWARGIKRPDSQKLSPYECGFSPFGQERFNFDVRYYLVAILFIVFDLEIAFLFPWAISLRKLGFVGFFSMLVFLSVLGIGFFYEWKKGALEWE